MRSGYPPVAALQRPAPYQNKSLRKSGNFSGIYQVRGCHRTHGPLYQNIRIEESDLVNPCRTLQHMTAIMPKTSPCLQVVCQSACVVPGLVDTGIEPRYYGLYDDRIWRLIEQAVSQAKGIIITTEYVRDRLVRPLVTAKLLVTVPEKKEYFSVPSANRGNSRRLT